MNDPFQTVLDALERTGCSPVGQGDRRRAPCPVHESHGLTLSVGLGAAGQVLLSCFAGCSTESVVQKIGLEWRDLFPGGRRPQTRRRGSAQKKRPIDVLLKLLREREIAYACTSSPNMWVVDDCPVCHAGSRWPLWLFEEPDGRVGASCCNGCDQDDVFDVITGRIGRKAAA